MVSVTSRPCFNPRNPGTHGIGGWVGLSAVSTQKLVGKSFSSDGDWTLVVQSAAGHYTDWAAPQLVVSYPGPCQTPPYQELMSSFRLASIPLCNHGMALRHKGNISFIILIFSKDAEIPYSFRHREVNKDRWWELKCLLEPMRGRVDFVKEARRYLKRFSEYLTCVACLRISLTTFHFSDTFFSVFSLSQGNYSYSGVSCLKLAACRTAHRGTFCTSTTSTMSH